MEEALVVPDWESPLRSDGLCRHCKTMLLDDEDSGDKTLCEVCYHYDLALDPLDPWDNPVVTTMWDDDIPPAPHLRPAPLYEGKAPAPGETFDMKELIAT